MWPTFLNTLTWPQWLLLGAIPPAIVALYFLKLRRAPLEVPSTYLWKKSIEDLHVNSLWQKLRQNLLLLLQLLLVLFIILALLRPSWQSDSLSGARFILLLDNSASMSATDVGESRLAEAKRQALEFVERMDSGDQALVISFADGAHVEQEFTGNRRALRRAIEGLQPTERPTSLLAALKLANGLAQSLQAGAAEGAGPQLDLYVFSDGKFPNVEGLPLANMRPVFVPIGKADEGNVGIIAFSTKRHETKPEQVQAFFLLQNSGPAEQEVDATLYRDGGLVDAKRVTVAAGKTAGDVFTLASAESGILRLEIKPEDKFALDNRAYAVLETPRRGRVLLVTPGNEPVQWAVTTLEAQLRAEVTVDTPGVLQTKDYQQAAAAGAYDLVIYDQCRPEQMPQANTLFIGKLPPLSTTPEPTAGATGAAGDQKAPDKVAAAADKKTEPATAEKPRYSSWSSATEFSQLPLLKQPQVLDTQRNHPLMQLVELGDIFLGSSILLEPPPGGATLIETTKGPVAAIAPRDGFEDVVIGFEIISAGEGNDRLFNTDWWRRQSFPTFWLNVLSYLGGGVQSQSALSLHPGEVPSLRSLTQPEQIEVLNPLGRKQPVARGPRNEFPFAGTEKTGVYEIYEAGKLTGRFTVNLFDSNETNIAPRLAEEEPIRIGYVEVADSADFSAARRETWKWLLLVGLVVLLLEWYIYNRRVYV